MSSIAAEIELNINRADWDADCYKGCRRLLLRETQRMGVISDDRGLEEIPVLMDFEVQHWVAEALENATRVTELILGRVASMGMYRPNRDQQEAGDLDTAASRATQALMRAATAYPLSDAQLERIVKLAMGKRVLAAPAVMAGGNPPQALAATANPGGGHQTEPEVGSESEDESHATDCTRPEGPPLTRGVVRPTSPRPGEAAALESSGAPASQPPGGDLSVKMMITVPGGKR